MNKDELRKQIIKKRKDILNKKKKSTIIVDKIINLDFYKKAKVIAIYNNMTNEVDLSYLKDIDKIVLLPKVVEDKMIFIKIDNNTKYKNSSFGVSEPIGEEYLGNIDLIIVPGVGFDKELNRLGYGKGYYDKYLSGKNIYKIGVCFKEQIVDSLPVDKYDIKMDLVITEKEFY